MNGIFQLPDSIIEGEFLKAARYLISRGNGELALEFVDKRIKKFGNSRGNFLLEQVGELVNESRGRGNRIAQIHEERSSEIRFKGPGPVATRAEAPLLKVVK